MAVLLAPFWCKSWNWSLRSRDMPISLKTSWQIGEKLILRKGLKVWSSMRSIGIQAIQKSIFYMKTQFLHQILQSTWRVSIEDSKICETSKSTVEPYFEIFWFCTPVTQNQVFRQLVPFNMLSHMLCMENPPSWIGLSLMEPEIVYPCFATLNPVLDVSWSLLYDSVSIVCPCNLTLGHDWYDWCRPWHIKGPFCDPNMLFLWHT